MTVGRPILSALVSASMLACQGQPEEPASSTGPEDATRPNIVLIDIDSLRADRLWAERDGQAVAPNLRALAAQGVVFEQAITQGGWTMPALSSILAGRHPAGVFRRTEELSWLPTGARTLPEILGWYDYQTAIVAGGTLVSESSSIGSRFQKVVPCDVRSGPAPVQPLASWIEREAREPFFVLLHDLDLHMPGGSVPLEASCTWVPDADRCALAAGMSPPKAWETLAPRLGEEQAREQIVAQYDGAIHAYDAAIPTLLEALDQRGIRDHTVVVLISNHGEELGEHGEFSHGVLYDTVLHVPLFVVDFRRPDMAGRRVATMVQAIDLAPTLLELAGLPRDETMDGHSLVPLMGGRLDDYPVRPAFSLSDALTASRRTPDSKLYVHPSRPGGKRPNLGHGAPMVGELYDLGADPGEHEDRAASEPAAFAEAWRELEAWLHEPARATETSAHAVPPSDPRMVERLQKDGYWQHVERSQPPSESSPPSWAKKPPLGELDP